jgi:hypothetical protein
MIIAEFKRQNIHRIKRIKKCPSCKKSNFSSVWYYLLGYEGYNGGDLTNIKHRIQCFRYVKSMLQRIKDTRRIDLAAKKHCFNCGTDIDYNLLHYSRF